MGCFSPDATGFGAVRGLELKETRMRSFPRRAGLRVGVGWNQFSTAAKHQSWWSKRAQEKTLTEGKAQRSWEGGTLGEQLEGMERVLERKPTEQTHTHSSLWCRRWKTSLHFVSDARESKRCISSTLTSAPCPPVTISEIRMSYSWWVHWMYQRPPKGDINTLACLTVSVWQTGKYGQKESI